MAGEIIIYSDGAASGNPGKGGYGVVLISGRHRLEKSEGFRLTTNNRMELLAVITGLESLKIPGSSVVVYTDSRYVADSVEKGWVFQWESRAFRKKKNRDLWIRFLKAYRKHNVRFVWIKGHASNPENELCDRLAVEAYGKDTLLEDTGYNPEDENDDLFSESGT
jgi:ribonuclease HI